ncbi:MAG: 5-oxoprolinase subunit PxpA [Flavobacteriaceae bacterium]|nr:5-oxoprolinase subunit PxpA [Flavobacteriaceae bacterium]
MQTIDINCDVGEGLGNEIDIIPYISSCSIACGSHAGDEKTIVETIKLALQHSVKIGAHPSFPDKENFGRKEIDITPEDLQLSIEDQIKLVNDTVKRLNGKLHHVKPHGALYNLSAVNKEMAQIVVNAVKNTVNDTFLYVPYNSVIQKLALKHDLKIKVEAFTDRNYNTDLTLVSREKENALIVDREILMKHLLKMVTDHKLISIDGVEVKIIAETFCIHGDNPNVKNLLKFLHKKLPENGIKIV